MRKVNNASVSFLWVWWGGGGAGVVMGCWVGGGGAVGVVGWWGSDGVDGVVVVVEIWRVLWGRCW